jgi:rSAM/selenodomain-associated transferase 1
LHYFATGDVQSALGTIRYLANDLAHVAFASRLFSGRKPCAFSKTLFMTTRRALIVFAKAPVPGYAKTRLIPELGEQGAAQLHAELCRLIVHNCVSPPEWDTLLWCAPDPQQALFQALHDDYAVELFSQTEGDLGQRMFHAFEQTLGRYDQAVIIGTDCPLMDAARIRQAFAALTQEFAAVVNPAEDGGYVLLGMASPEAVVFQDIEWGSGQVWTQTRQRMESLGLKYQVLDTLWDVDDTVGLRRYQALAMV